MAVVRRETKTGEVRYDVLLRRPDGREVSRTFKTLRTAEQFEREQLHARDRGAMHDPRAGRITLGEWVAEWRSIRGALRPSTVRIYETNLSLHVLPVLGGVELASLDRQRLRRWVSGLSARELKPATVHQAVRTLRTVLAAAVDTGRIVSNPAAGRGLAPRIEKAELRIPTPTEVATLADSIHPRYRALVFVAAYCGLRRGELAGLRWERVDLLRRRLDVVEQLRRTKGGNADIWSPKTDHSRRVVPIPAAAAAALREHLDAGHSQPTGLIFTMPTGLPFEPSEFRRRFWVPAVAQAGLDGLTLHDLRHCCASLMIASGADLKAVQSVMGHGSATVTLDTYGHLFPDRLDDLLTRMDLLTADAKPVPIAPVVPLAR